MLIGVPITEVVIIRVPIIEVVVIIGVPIIWEEGGWPDIHILKIWVPIIFVEFREALFVLKLVPYPQWKGGGW